MFENAQYKFLEISILVKIFEKILFLAKISKILNFQIFGNSIYWYFLYIIPNLVKIMVNPDFFKLTENHDFSEILWKISNLFEIPWKISTL